MALDGFVIDVSDTPTNARAFGRPGSGRAPAAFPQARILALCPTSCRDFAAQPDVGQHRGFPADARGDRLAATATHHKRIRRINEPGT
jgi:hypothetical protein